MGFVHLDGGGSSGGECPSTCNSGGTPQVSSLPPAMRVRLYELFVQIEREFEILYAENISLQVRGPIKNLNLSKVMQKIYTMRTGQSTI